MNTRRALLAAAPALLLAGCGSDAPDEPAADPNVDLGTQKRGDIALLNQLITGDIGYDDTTRALQEAVRALGGRPASAGASDGFSLEATQRAYALYLDVIPKLADGRARELCAGFLADRAGQIARVRLFAGEDAVPEAFVT